MLLSKLHIVLTLALFTQPFAAQQTHQVNLFATTYAPANLNINLGDTVLWDWQVGTHNVESGTIFTGPDGNFVSGSVESNPATTYSLTFDTAFLQAHPMPNNSYPYFCVVHAGQGMTGTVNVNVPATVRSLGCGVNPSGSINILSGSPMPGTSMTLGLDNPLGTQPVGSIPFLAVSNFSFPNDPCGVSLPGFGMNGVGELLVGVGAGQLFPPLLVGGPWTGIGNPSPINISIPNDTSLVGLEVYVQGVLFNPSGSSPRFGLTDGYGLLIGN